jgi:uncharacterized repeat protein (TIGR02543 family)
VAHLGGKHRQVRSRMRHFKKLAVATVIVIGATSLSSFAAGDTVDCSEAGSFTVLENAVNGDNRCEGSAIIPGTVTSIGGNAFKDAPLLTSITIPSTVTSIGGTAFKATGLTSITFEGNAPSVGNNAFDSIGTNPRAYFRVGATGFGEIGADWNGFTLAHSYDVTFDAQSGTRVALQNTAEVELSPDTTRTGYTFQGWFESASGGTEIIFPYSLSDDITLYAQWLSGTYDVTFDAQSGTSVALQNTASVDPSPSTTRTGYAFQGWFESASDGIQISFPYTISGDVTLYAQWTAIPAYDVTFDAQSGTSVALQNTASVASSPRTTRTGYAFQGWFESASGGTAIGVPYLLSDDTTLYAQWLLIVLPPANQSPVLAQAPLETAAPTPTTPTEPVSAAGGSVEGSNETLDVTSNDEDGSMMVSGSDWQLEVASNRVTSDSQPANEDQRLVFQPETRVEIAAQGLMPESAVALWVFSEPTFAGEVQTDSTGKFEANMDMPDGLAPGDHTLQVLSRDSKGRVITLNFPIVVAEKVVQKVNALSFKGFVALFVKGYEGQRLSAKVGKDWVVVPSIAAAGSNLFRRLESVGSGVDCSVRMYIDYALIDTINLTTK